MQPEEGAALSCTGLDWSQLRCNLSLNQIQIRTPPGYHSSLAWPDVLLCDLESGLNLSGGSLRRRAPAFRFGPYCPPPRHLRLSELSLFGLQSTPLLFSCQGGAAAPRAGPAIVEGLAILHIPRQSLRVYMVWFATLTVLARQDPASSRPFLAASSGPLPKSWLCACLPSTHCPCLSSSTCGLPSLWPPVSIPGSPANGHLPTPWLDTDTVVYRGNRHAPHPPGA